MSESGGVGIIVRSVLFRVVPFVVLVFVLAFVLFVLGGQRYRNHVLSRVDEIDAVALRVSLREVLAEGGCRGSVSREKWPKEVAELRPRTVLRREGYLLVYMSSLARVSILVFSEDARQFGTKQLSDGVWFWNGHYAHGTEACKPEKAENRNDAGN